MENDSKQYITPPELAKLLGINPSTVKRWADKGLLPNTTTPGGHRRINKSQLGQFLQSNPKLHAHSYLLRNISENQPTPSWKAVYTKLSSQRGLPNTGLGLSYIAGANPFHIVTKIVLPILRHIGTEWSRGKLDIFEEHRMTFIIRTELVKLEQIIPEPKRHSPTAVLACISEEQHELPLVIGGIILKSLGYRTVMLGINTPAEETAKAANKYDAKMIILEKLYSNYSGKKYLENVCAHLDKSCPIFLTGNGWVTNKGVLQAKNILHLHNFEMLRNIPKINA